MLSNTCASLEVEPVQASANWSQIEKRLEDGMASIKDKGYHPTQGIKQQQLQ